MSAKTYLMKFGQGDPRTYTGLAPTFLQFFDTTGQTYAPPSIAEVKYGGQTASGIYGFSYLIGQSTANAIYFLAYSATTMNFTNDGYISGVLDPILAIDQALGITGSANSGIGLTLVSIGSTLVAIGNTTSTNFTNIGSTLISIGNTSIALGNTILSFGSFNASFIGNTASSFGSTSTDPSTVFGYLKRLQELLEGDQVFTGSSGTWSIYNRASLGTTTLLRTKTILNSGAQTNKTGL